MIDPLVDIISRVYKCVIDCRIKIIVVKILANLGYFT